MINEIFVYKTDCKNPYINLATENHLLETVKEDCAILFLWQNADTVVIGANQNPWAECDVSYLEQNGILLARRLTGGGAVFHDIGNLNFSFITNEKDYSLSKNLEIIQSACALAGIRTEFSGRNDLLANGGKFSGNAFLTKNKKSLHHGTLLIGGNFGKMSACLTPSATKLAAKGVKSVRSRVVNLTQLCPDLSVNKMKEYMTLAFERAYNLTAKVSDAQQNEQIINTSHLFSSREFLYKKTPPFTFECEGRCDLGNIRINLNVEKGRIKNSTVFSDFMDVSIPPAISSALTDTELEKEQILTVLSRIVANNIAIQITDIIMYK